MAYQRKWQTQLNNAVEKDEASLFKRLFGIYDREQKYLQREVDHYFAKYGENNVIKYRVLKESLDDDDKILLIEKFDDFVKKYPQYADLLPIRESIYKLDRLQGLQYSVTMQQLKIGAIEQSEVGALLKKTALRGANKTASELGFGTAFYKENDVIIKNFVGTDWTKAGDFSSRIWKNREELSNYINNDLAQSFARGDSRDKIVEQMEKRFNAGRKNTERLVYTENTFVMNEAQAKVFEQWFEYYSISTADSRACPVCRDLQAEQEREYARFDERESGINFPPMHPWCRCTFNVQVNKSQWMKDYILMGGNPLAASKLIAGATGSAIISSLANPSSTIKEARERTKNLATSVEGIDKATNLENLNAMNCSVEEMYSKYNAKKLDSIKINNRGKRNMAANGDLLIAKTDYLNSPSMFDWAEHIKKYKAQIEDYAKKLEICNERGLTANSKAYAKAIKELEERIKYKRWSYSSFQSDGSLRVRATTYHEFGHVLADQYIGQINGKHYINGAYSQEKVRELNILVGETFKRAKATGDIYDISCYASTDKIEFFAECFCARELGMDLPKYVEDMLKEVLGK